MISLSVFMDNFLKAVKETFGSRVQFVGLQGSYARGEADENSDIDTVVILDELLPVDIEAYNKMLDAFSERALLCGFISGKEELLEWLPSELFQFYYDTEPVFGSLDFLLPLIDDRAVIAAVKSGICSIYHGCVHNMLYEKSSELLMSLYKSSAFVIQAILFLETGKYVRQKKDVARIASGTEKKIIDNFLLMRRGEKIDFSEASEQLFLWCKSRLNKDNG